MRSNPTLMVSLRYAIYLVSMLLATYCLVFSNKGEKLCCPYPSLAAGWEQMEETFVASSTGEGMELINMVQQEDYQRLRNSAVKDLLLNQCEIIVVVTDDGNVNIYLCFKITY
uniref:Uncharacterized protein n=1 Tax=Anas platyrhynchos platyrhynchos TaxID=8840 RepID=A0A493TWL9_ANAPP